MARSSQRSLSDDSHGCTLVILLSLFCNVLLLTVLTVFFRNDVNQSIAVPVNLLLGMITTRVDETLRQRQRSVR